MVVTYPYNKRDKRKTIMSMATKINMLHEFLITWQTKTIISQVSECQWLPDMAR